MVPLPRGPIIMYTVCMRVPADSEEFLISLTNYEGQGHHAAVWRTWGEAIDRATQAFEHHHLASHSGMWRDHMRAALEAVLLYDEEELEEFRRSRIE